MRISNLCKNYNGMKAVKNLSLDVYKGEILGFLGPNGAGKTTTINMICGLLKADAGEIIIDGLSIKSNPKEARALIGMCPQNIVIWKDLTCIEQIEFMGTMYNIEAKEARNRGIELLAAMGLIEKKDKMGKALSGGMQRRLNIILALIHDPQIVILDEPEAGLDPQSRILVRNYIKNLAEHKTIILTSHNMDEVERLADRVAIVDKGELLTVNTPDMLKRHEEEGEVLEIKISGIGQENVEGMKKLLLMKVDRVAFSEGVLSITSKNVIDNITGVINILSSKGVTIEDLRIRKRNLEDVFISLTGRELRE